VPRTVEPVEKVGSSAAAAKNSTHPILTEPKLALEIASIDARSTANVDITTFFNMLVPF
jgi:hypothetical protein